MSEKKYVSIRGARQRAELIGKTIRFNYKYGSARTGVVTYVVGSSLDVGGIRYSFDQMKDVEIIEDTHPQEPTK